MESVTVCRHKMRLSVGRSEEADIDEIKNSIRTARANVILFPSSMTAHPMDTVKKAQEGRGAAKQAAATNMTLSHHEN